MDYVEKPVNTSTGVQPGAGHSSAERIWTVPNVISLVRVLVFLPFSLALIAADYPGWALVALTFTGLSDAADGFLARKLNQVSSLGKEVDPVSDRVTVVLVSVALAYAGLLPWFFLGIIFGLDLIMLIIVSVIFDGQPGTEASWAGKARTALLLVGLPMLLLAATLHSQALREVGLVLVAAGVVGQIIAFFGYLRQMFGKRNGRAAV